MRYCIEYGLDFEITNCRSDYAGSTRSTQQLRANCIAAARAYADDKMSKLGL